MDDILALLGDARYEGTIPHEEAEQVRAAVKDKAVRHQARSLMFQQQAAERNKTFSLPAEMQGMGAPQEQPTEAAPPADIGALLL